MKLYKSEKEKVIGILFKSELDIGTIEKILVAIELLERSSKTETYKSEKNILGFRRTIQKKPKHKFRFSSYFKFQISYRLDNISNNHLLNDLNSLVNFINVNSNKHKFKLGSLYLKYSFSNKFTELLFNTINNTPNLRFFAILYFIEALNNQTAYTNSSDLKEISKRINEIN